MYSKAKLFGHPIHPFLVAFPITFYTSTFFLYLAYSAWGADTFWFRVGLVANIAGVLTAVIAAVPGFIDWAFGIPTGSPAKMTGLLHMTSNVISLLLFGAAALINYDKFNLTHPNIVPSLILSGIGIALTLIAGFLGWKLIGVHHVGVDLSSEQERLEPSARDYAHRGKNKLVPIHRT